MRRGHLLPLGLSTSLLLAAALCTAATQAFAAEPTEADPERETSAPKEAEDPSALAPGAKPAAPATAPVAPADVVLAPAAKPKVGDVAVSGYFRGGFGASNQHGRMTCFQLALPNGMLSKYRLGNECEVWSETHFTIVTYTGGNGTVATMHFMPTVFIPTTFIGYTPTGVVNSPLLFTTSTGATLSFPTLYADIKGIPWLFGGTAWAGTRYYKRESVYISDFFYWNPSGVGVGVEDVKLPWGLELSYAAFAVDGRLQPGPVMGAPELPNQVDFGIRNDLQLRGIPLWWGAELQLGFQYIANYSNNPSTHGGWGGTLRLVQKVWGGDLRIAIQYGRGAGTGFGTLARFYYPDFSLYNNPNEYRFRGVQVLTMQPHRMIGLQAAYVYQFDDLGNAGQKTTWRSSGGRVSLGVLENLKLLGEVGYDQIEKSNGAPLQYLAKFTGAVALTSGREFLTRPELRLFLTWARWNEAARTATIDSGQLYTNTIYLSGMTFGAQAETWW